jgi:hypothetical protein
MTWLRVEPFTAELLVWVLERHLDDSRLVRRRVSVADVMPLAKGDDVLEPISPAEQAALMAAVEREGHGDKQGRCDCPRCEERRSRRTEEVLGGDRIRYAGTGNRVIGQGPVIHYGQAVPVVDVGSNTELEAVRIAHEIDREIVGELTVKELRVPALLVDKCGRVLRAFDQHNWVPLPCDQFSPNFYGCTVDCRDAETRVELDHRTVLLFCASQGELPLGRIIHHKHHKREGWIDRDDPKDDGTVAIGRRELTTEHTTKGGEDGQ